jgi:hypothetical protein
LRALRAPFRELLARDRKTVLDGEIAEPDERGVTYIGRFAGRDCRASAGDGFTVTTTLAR